MKAPLELWDQRDKKVILRKWETRWHAENRRLGRVEQPQPPEPGPGNPRRYTAYCKDSGAPQEPTESRECFASPNTYRKDRACPGPAQPARTRLPDSELPV